MQMALLTRGLWGISSTGISFTKIFGAKAEALLIIKFSIFFDGNSNWQKCSKIWAAFQKLLPKISH
jgi:hypothetical protein